MLFRSRDAIAQLVRMQYQRNDTEFTRGKFRVRGDVIGRASCRERVSSVV